MAQSETAIQNAANASASEPGTGRLFKFGFFISVAMAMAGWLSFLGWLAMKIFNL